MRWEQLQLMRIAMFVENLDRLLPARVPNYSTRPDSRSFSDEDHPACAPFPPATSTRETCRPYCGCADADTFCDDPAMMPYCIQEGRSALHRVFKYHRSEERRVGKECRSRWS